MTVVKFGVNSGGGHVAGCFEMNIRMDAQIQELATLPGRGHY